MIRYANQVNTIIWLLHIKQQHQYSIRQLQGLRTKAPKVASATIFIPCSCTIYDIEEEANNTEVDNEGLTYTLKFLYPESEIRQYYWNKPQNGT